MIDPKPRVSGEGILEIVEKGVDRLVSMTRAQRVSRGKRLLMPFTLEVAIFILEVQQHLDGVSPADQVLGSRALQKVRRFADAPARCAFEYLEFLPSDRHRHRRVFASACAIRHDRGRATLVAQIVDEDPPGAFGLWRARR